MKIQKKILIVFLLIIITDIFKWFLFSDILKYSFIIMLLISAYFSKDKLLFSAFFMSSLADFMLIFTSKYQLGMLFFSIAFCIYIIRHSGQKLLIPIIFLAVFILNKTGIPYIYIVYVCLFYINLYYVFKNCRRLFLPFFLFAICDIITALRFYCIKIPSYVIWMFYAPAIYLIVFTPATM
jgi:hypothetical protein